MDTFGSPILEDVAFNQDGSLKQSGKQNVKFYLKKRLNFKARPLKDKTGEFVFDKDGRQVFDIDKKTGLPFKDAFEDEVEMVRIETRGDTNIVDDVANDFHRRQFYRQYKFFRDGKIPDGNPIEDFEFLQPATILELHYFGIHVIQQVADMDEDMCRQIKDQSGFEIRDIAAQWVKIHSPQGQAGRADKLARENKQLRKDLEAARAGSSMNSKPTMTPFVASEPTVAEDPIKTLEISPEQIRRPRSVE